MGRRPAGGVTPEVPGQWDGRQRLRLEQKCPTVGTEVSGWWDGRQG